MKNPTKSRACPLLLDDHGGALAVVIGLFVEVPTLTGLVNVSS